MQQTALVVHGHFYQPPRENPWTNTIDRQPSAHPFHNWNERIYRECYRPNAYARILDTYGRVEAIINNYTNISFNFGPTLLSWLELHHPETYTQIIEADQASVLRRHGHGNAIAQGYHHSILPLCNERDRRTEIRWGIADFKHRFRRDPESLWLPETACNDATLGALIDAKLKFVILSPHQAERVRPIGAEVWQSVIDGSIDTTIPYKYFHTDKSGRSITIFFYDGHIAKAVAFDGVLASSHMLVDRFERSVSGKGQIVNVATDGESYGHHYHFGDRCLAYALESEAASRGFFVTNYGEFLAEHEPEMEVEIKRGLFDEGTAWSCAHGLGRWSRDCSCHAGAPQGWNQAWRAPLRTALNYLRDEAARHFETLGGDLFRDPWQTRDDYIELIIDPTRDRNAFLTQHAGRSLNKSEEVRALMLLELQRSALLMFTSCGWFFNDISGIETVQVLKYAGRVLDFLADLGTPSPREAFLELLAEARSNVARYGNGAEIFERAVATSRITPQRVAASLAISSLINLGEAVAVTAGYRYTFTDFQKQHHGRLTLATGRLQLETLATGRIYDYALAAMHFGDVDFYCVLKNDPGDESFKRSTEKLWSYFRTGSLPAMLRLVQEEFGSDEYSLEHLLPDGRHRVYEILFGQMVERFTELYEFLYEENRRNIEMLQEAGFELPLELKAAAEFTMGRRFEEEIHRHEQQHDPTAYREALTIAEEATRRGYRIDRTGVHLKFEEMMTSALRFMVDDPSTENIQGALALVQLTKNLCPEANFERAQEIVYQALHQQPSHVDELQELAAKLGLAPIRSGPESIGARAPDIVAAV